ncbi:MAG: hypothetical protein AAF806_24020 [Bacteroidota bacterium]
MNTIQLEIQENRYLLSIDKTFIDRNYLDRLIRSIRIEYLAAQVNFEDDIEDLGEEIQNDWWQANKAKLLKEE